MSIGLASLNDALSEPAYVQLSNRFVTTLAVAMAIVSLFSLLTNVARLGDLLTQMDELEAQNSVCICIFKRFLAAPFQRNVVMYAISCGAYVTAVIAINGHDNLGSAMVTAILLTQIVVSLVVSYRNFGRITDGTSIAAALTLVLVFDTAATAPGMVTNHFYLMTESAYYAVLCTLLGATLIIGNVVERYLLLRRSLSEGTRSPYGLP